MKPSPTRPARTALFRPRQFVTPPSLLLVPYFTEPTLYAGLRRDAGRRQSILHSSLLVFERFALLSGFLGYPQLLLLLGMVSGLEDKEVFFLGSAGALSPRFREPIAVQAGEIAPSAVFTRFSPARRLGLKTFAGGDFPVVRGVSVDIIQRETPAWLAAQRRRRADIVEMELFPLRWFLGRPFHALLVLSDRVESTGIRPFAQKEKFSHEFHRAFRAITRHIEHE
ncbi:MAG: hypothetical protein JXO51_07195 [Candidatus Aminicenantes bacterium]|nr:hypothetical protein [Candidatus Aminicenantes bacterium]